jgi:hypothetical protein
MNWNTSKESRLCKVVVEQSRSRGRCLQSDALINLFEFVSLSASPNSLHALEERSSLSLAQQSRQKTQPLQVKLLASRVANKESKNNTTTMPSRNKC